MIFLPMREIGVADSGVADALLVSSGAAGVETAPARGEGPPPPHARGSWGKGQIVVLEGDHTD